MGRMVRKQVYIEPRQDQLLKRRARDLDVPEAELIRRGIDQIARAPMASHPDLGIWEEEKAFIREARQFEVPQTGRGWTRDELYEERLGRIPG